MAPFGGFALVFPLISTCKITDRHVSFIEILSPTVTVASVPRVIVSVLLVGEFHAILWTVPHVLPVGGLRTISMLDALMHPVFIEVENIIVIVSPFCSPVP